MAKPPPLQNDCFALPPGVNWTPVDQALQMLNERLSCVTDIQTRAVGHADGYILAAPVFATSAHPPHTNSAVDGYGVTGPISDGAHDIALLDARSAAGAPYSGQVPAGHAIRILTGAQLPDGIDTVVMQEDVVIDGARVHLNGPLKRGANVRPAGEDVEFNAMVLDAGHRLSPPDIGLLASVGVHQVDVYAPLRVAAMSTGAELREIGEGTSDAQIVDANRPMLIAQLRRWGYQVVDMGIISDDQAAVQAALDHAATQADVILTSGGASAGDEDHMAAVLNARGAMDTWRVAIKPGRPLAMGTWDGVPVFGLPGNPVAAFVCTLIFARMALAKMGGEHVGAPDFQLVPAAFEKRKKQGRREYLRAKLIDGHAHVFPSEGSGRISGLSWADGLVELPDEALDITHGALVKYIPFTAF
ncbi:MAG: gephyrin-like molybdotransferase Glp [Planktomarina sp.]